MDDMTSEQKQNLIDYMVKYCGLSPNNANRRFDDWESVRADKSAENIKARTKLKKGLIEDKEMTDGQIRTMIMYMYRHGYIVSWIADSIGISESLVYSTLKRNNIRVGK